MALAGFTFLLQLSESEVRWEVGSSKWRGGLLDQKRQCWEKWQIHPQLSLTCGMDVFGISLPPHHQHRDNWRADKGHCPDVMVSWVQGIAMGYHLRAHRPQRQDWCHLVMPKSLLPWKHGLSPVSLSIPRTWSWRTLDSEIPASQVQLQGLHFTSLLRWNQANHLRLGSLSSKSWDDDLSASQLFERRSQESRRKGEGRMSKKACMWAGSAGGNWGPIPLRTSGTT